MIQEFFSPSREEIAYAQRIVEGYKVWSQVGKGAFGVDGFMVDMVSFYDVLPFFLGGRVVVVHNLSFFVLKARCQVGGTNSRERPYRVTTFLIGRVRLRLDLYI